MHPEEIAGEILSSIKRRLEEKYPGHKIKAAISVPAYFDPAEKQATLDAAMIAGLQVSDMLIEGKRKGHSIFCRLRGPKVLGLTVLFSCQNLLLRRSRTTDPRWLPSPASTSWSLI